MRAPAFAALAAFETAGPAVTPSGPTSSALEGPCYNAEPMRRGAESLLEECRTRAIALLRANLTPAGILAAAPSRRAEARGYTAIFGRDAAIAALGMIVSGDRALERGAVAGLVTLAA